MILSTADSATKKWEDVGWSAAYILYKMETKLHVEG